MPKLKTVIEGISAHDESSAVDAVDVAVIPSSSDKAGLANVSTEKIVDDWIPANKISENVVISSSSGVNGKSSDEIGNLVVVSTPQPERTNKLNTSTITIISDLTDASNSLATNISQVCTIVPTFSTK